jgi:hypothetical protein
MNEALLTAGQIGMACIMLIFFFKLNSGFEKFKRELTGKGEKREISPQPLIVTPQVRVATFDELSQLRREFEVFRTEQRESNKELLEVGETRSIALHNRINDVLAAVCRLEGKNK